MDVVADNFGRIMIASHCRKVEGARTVILYLYEGG